jgi:hypothetical protein
MLSANAHVGGGRPARLRLGARSLSTPFGLLIAGAAMLLSVIGGRPAHAQYRETFEGPETSWQLADHDGQVRVLRHARTYDQAREGLASEHLRLQVGPGTYVHWSHAVPRAMVIDELQISLWIKSNRANLPFSARVVLPRSKDPRTGGPLTTLIRGTAYRQAGVWEKLTIQTPTRLLAQQVPLLRSEFGSDVDAREAYIDRLVLNAYGGPGVTDVWIDDLELVGHVSMDPPSPGALSLLTSTADGTAATTSSSGPEQGAQLAGSVLVVGGRARLARVIEHQGESFAWLKSLGFNAVRLATPPSAEQLREAREHDLWLMAPPPVSQGLPEDGAPGERVLAWDLGDHLRANHLESTRAVARQLRSVPEAARRPLICLPREELWQYSRIADLVLLEPPGPNGSLPLGEFGQWYLQRSRLTRPGTHFWAAIRTELSPEITRQARVMSGRPDGSWSLEPEQIRCLVYHAVASGARGLVFRSQSRLDTSDPLTLLRAKTLEWLNHDLQLLEPWAATGSHVGELDAGDPTVRASVLQTDRSRIVLMIRRTADQQYVAGPLHDTKISLEVPGVPETDEIYQLGESGLKRISRPRGTGARIQLEAPRGISLVVLTQDPLVINFLARQIHDTRRRRDEILGEIAAQLYTAVVDTHQRLLESAPPPTWPDMP